VTFGEEMLAYISTERTNSPFVQLQLSIHRPILAVTCMYTFCCTMWSQSTNAQHSI